MNISEKLIFKSIKDAELIQEAIQSLQPKEQPKQKYSIELVDDGLYKLYVGRDNEHHGAWICSLVEFDMNKEATINAILNSLNNAEATNSVCIGVCGTENSEKVFELNRLCVDGNIAQNAELLPKQDVS